MICNGASTTLVFVLHAVMLVPSVSFGDPSCWFGAVNHQACCHPAHGRRGNEACWTAGFSFERCCAVDPALYQLQPHQLSYFDSRPAAATIQDALSIARQSELKKYILVTQMIFEQKDEIGFDPMASAAFLTGERLKGFLGYGEPGHRARIYYELACQSKLLLAQNVLSLCPQLTGYTLDHAQTRRKLRLLHISRQLTSDLFDLAGYLFRIALELLGWWHLSQKCQQRKHLSQVLAASLQTYWEKMAKALEELTVPQSFAPGMGSASSIVVERMSSPQLIDFWMKLVEGVYFAPCLDLVLNFVVLAYYIAEEAVRLRSHLFAQIYITELQNQSLPADSPKVTAPVPGQQFVFQQHSCCARYHVLLQLLEDMRRETKGTVSMIEIGVHTASTAKFLLERAPFLQWTGIDSYVDYTESGSGVRLFHEAQQNLAPFGSRAQLLRITSSEAWETTGALRGLDVKSVDLLFVDGDHDYNATFHDLKSWSRFVRSGGIISGHDIFNPVNDRVTDAVEDVLRGSNTPVRFATDHVYWWYAT